MRGGRGSHPPHAKDESCTTYSQTVQVKVRDAAKTLDAATVHAYSFNGLELCFAWPVPNDARRSQLQYSLPVSPVKRLKTVARTPFIQSNWCQHPSCHPQAFWKKDFHRRLALANGDAPFFGKSPSLPWLHVPIQLVADGERTSSLWDRELVKRELAPGREEEEKTLQVPRVSAPPKKRR